MPSTDPVNGSVIFTPHPIDTDGIEIPAALQPLVETLAQNVHDHWAQLRLREGWTYGRQRDDAQRTSPCLVPFANLPQEEKDYDRIIAQEVIKAILALGFSIAPAQ